MKQFLCTVKQQLILCLFAIILGFICGILCTVFGTVLMEMTLFRRENYQIFLPFLGIAGVGIVWCYRKFGGESSKGMALLFELYQNQRDSIPLRLIPLIVLNTWITHLFGGSAGREGVAVQIGGTVGAFLGGKLSVKNAQKTMMIAGMAAGFGGLFRTPLAATIFALEVLSVGTLEYGALCPALIAASCASFVSGKLGLEKFSIDLEDTVLLSLDSVWKLAVLGIVFGLLGALFSHLLRMLKKIFSKWVSHPMLRILVIGSVVGLASLACFQGRYSGLGSNLISAGFNQGIYPWDFALKLLFTTVTLAAGYQGGEVTPLFSIGVASGFVLAGIVNLPVALCAALGYCAVFGGATNTLLAPVVIGMEVFGGQAFPALVIVCAVSFFCSGNHSIYSLQKCDKYAILFSKEK